MNSVSYMVLAVDEHLLSTDMTYYISIKRLLEHYLGGEILAPCVVHVVIYRWQLHHIGKLFSLST